MMREGAQWLNRILAISGAGDFPILRCKGLNAYGMMFTLANNWQDSIELFRESIQVSRAAGYQKRLAQALSYLGWTYQFASRFEQSEALSREGLGIYQDIGDQRGIAVSHNNLAWISFFQADLARAGDPFLKIQRLQAKYWGSPGLCFRTDL